MLLRRVQRKSVLSRRAAIEANRREQETKKRLERTNYFNRANRRLKRRLQQDGDGGFPWKKYEGEYHLPGGYNYVGPGTDLKKRLDENDKPRAGEEPINELDAIALQHDLDYRAAGNDRGKQRAADLKMVKSLESLPRATKLSERFFRWLARLTIKAKAMLRIHLPQ